MTKNSIKAAHNLLGKLTLELRYCEPSDIKYNELLGLKNELEARIALASKASGPVTLYIGMSEKTRSLERQEVTEALKQKRKPKFWPEYAEVQGTGASRFVTVDSEDMEAMEDWLTSHRLAWQEI